MKEHLKSIIRDMRAGNLYGVELQEKESVLLQALRLEKDFTQKYLMLTALQCSGTILSVPTVLGLILHRQQDLVHQELNLALQSIQIRAKERGSALPNEFYTPDYWKMKWQGSRNAFLSYVYALVSANQRYKEDSDGLELESNRVGDLLISEMGVNISPYSTFQELKLCTTDWDYESEMQLLLDRLEQERILDSLAEQGLDMSVESYIIENLMDLQHDYLITRLELAEDYDYYQFALKMAAGYNEK